jgi:GNAT superfamily N-acetyltransferase
VERRRSRIRNARRSRGLQLPDRAARKGRRRQGIAGALIAAAVSHARSRGARIIEGYPVDVQEKQKNSSADLYHGTDTLFAGAGFEESARPIPGRAVMTLAL